MDMAPWNAALVAHGAPTTHIAPTLDLTVQFQPRLLDASDWMLLHTESPVAANGLFGAHSKLWSQSGKLIAIGAAQALCAANPHWRA
jgi:acyl-CoA thioesterase